MPRPSIRLTLLAATAALAVVAVTPTSAQLLQRKDLSFSMAVQIAEGALAECRSHNWPSSAVVLDRGGNVMVMMRDDGAGPHTMENARRKAYTALTFKTTSEEFAKLMETSAVRRQQATLPGVIGIPGGVPLKVGNDVIASVGLSGSPGKDEMCVQAGIDKVKQYLQ